MVRSEIISKLSKKTHKKLNRSDLDKILQVVLDTIIEGIRNNTRTELRSWGIFYPKKLKEKVSRDPRTGNKIYIPEKLSMAFKMSKDLKEKLNQNRIRN
tara:strand:+ start:2013 stop:2309 length:297 start_codon:yes stop_codon:yes gene_type:complete